MKPAPDGQYVPHLDWRRGHPRPLVVHIFQVEGGCSHFVVGTRPRIEVRGDQVIATVADRQIERTQGPALTRLLAWVKTVVQSSVDKSRQAAAHTRVTVGGQPLDARLVRAALVADELRVSLQITPARQNERPMPISLSSSNGSGASTSSRIASASGGASSPSR